MSETPRMYDEMPLSQLTRDYEQWAERIAGANRDETEVRLTGLLLRAYMYMFTMGPLRDDLESLPDHAHDGLVRVGEACLKVLLRSQEVDTRPIYTYPLPSEADDDGHEKMDVYSVIQAAQTSLEVAEEPPKGEILEQLRDNEFTILSGQVEIGKFPLRRMDGPSDFTKEAIYELAVTAGKQFGAIAGGLEFVIPEADQKTWNDYKNQLAVLMQSRWRNPEYVGPDYSRLF